MKGMAELTWSREDHSWLAKRNRSTLQQTQEGREELRSFDDAPLLMDGRVDTVSGAIGANRINRLKLEQVSADTKKPILSMGAYYTTPKTEKGQKMEPSQIGAEDFRGMEDMVLLCEGARVLLTQNLWVEAGLMNGALGYVRGFMFPQNFDPSSKEKELQAPICVFIEFDSVNLGTDENGTERTFFPNDPERKKWIPIFRQEVASTVEEHVTRANFPVTLAWALTHWKAQGMTLDKVRVHLSNRTAGIPGIGFVACTRVRHPWNLVFQEDLPEYGEFMKAKNKKEFRERKRFELKMEARASWTLRKYGFCEADLWSGKEAGFAEDLLNGLKRIAEQQRDRLKSTGYFPDSDWWLWGDREPDYVSELKAQVVELAGGDEERKKLYESVADRLLDLVRVRSASADECLIADKLLAGEDYSAMGPFALEANLQEKKNKLFPDCGN